MFTKGDKNKYLKFINTLTGISDHYKEQMPCLFKCSFDVIKINQLTRKIFIFQDSKALKRGNWLRRFATAWHFSRQEFCIQKC
jgi:hypothetical protein